MDGREATLGGRWDLKIKIQFSLSLARVDERNTKKHFVSFITPIKTRVPCISVMVQIQHYTLLERSFHECE